MNPLKKLIAGLMLATAGLLPLSAGAVTAPALADAHTNSALPANNFGSLPTLNVGGTYTSLMQFDFSSLPGGTTGSSVAKATLFLWVNKIGSAGAINIRTVTDAWSETSVTHGTQPTVGGVAYTVPVTSAGKYIAVDVTTDVKNWIDAPASALGFAFGASTSAPGTSVFIDSKENTATGHVAYLDITLVGQPGPQGSQGNPGLIGPTGPAGPQGLTGATGPQGPAGINGPQGLKGDQGDKGDPGTTPDVSVLIARLNVLESLVSAFSKPTRAYVTNLGTDSVSAFDTGANVVVGTVLVGDAPSGVAANPAGTRIYVANEGSHSVSVIDTANNLLVSTLISVPGLLSPTSVAVNPDGTRLYVANSGTNVVLVFDTSSNTVLGAVAVGNAPKSLAINPAGTRLYVVNQGSPSISVIDTANNSVIGTLVLTQGVHSPAKIVVNPAGTRAYLTDANLNLVFIIDTVSNTFVGTVAVGDAPNGIAVNPAGTRLYVANQGSDSISIIDTASNSVLDTLTGVPGLIGPVGAAVNPAGTNVYVTNGGSNSVTVIDAATNTRVGAIGVGGNPQNVVVIR